jgi:hypothetical protein
MDGTVGTSRKSLNERNKKHGTSCKQYLSRHLRRFEISLLRAEGEERESEMTQEGNNIVVLKSVNANKNLQREIRARMTTILCCHNPSNNLIFLPADDHKPHIFGTSPPYCYGQGQRLGSAK